MSDTAADPHRPRPDPRLDSRTDSGPGRTPVEPDAAAVRRSRRRLLVILACFGVPLLAATVYVQVLRASGGSVGDTSRGQLVQPTRPIEPFELDVVAGRGTDDGADGELGNAWGLDELRGLWTLLHVVEGECAEACETNLYHMRQVRLALNQRRDRVRRVAVVDSPDALGQALLAEHSGLVVIGGPPEAREVLVEQIRTAPVDGLAEDGTDAGGADPLDGIWLVDPNGNLVLRFAPDLDPRNMLKDVKHLLKVSRIG